MPANQVAAGSDLRAPARAKPWRKRLVIVGVFALAAWFALFLLSRAGSFLIVNAPERSDVIVALAGVWPKAMQLQSEGYAPIVLLDASVNQQIWGRTEADLATQFLERTKPPGVLLCPTIGDSTFKETADVQRCMQALHARSALIVISDFDTRQAIATFRGRLPQYRWSIAASSAPYHDADQYWKHRAWAKTVFFAWEQFLYWKLVDERRPDLVLH